MNAKLWHSVTRALASRLTQDGVSMPVVEVELLRLDASFAESGQKAEVPEDEDSGWLDIDADAECRQCAAGFEEVDVLEAASMQLKCCC